MRLLSILLLLCTSVYSQTSNPYVEEFDSFGGPGEWGFPLRTLQVSLILN